MAEAYDYKTDPFYLGMSEKQKRLWRVAVAPVKMSADELALLIPKGSYQGLTWRNGMYMIPNGKKWISLQSRLKKQIVYLPQGKDYHKKKYDNNPEYRDHRQTVNKNRPVSYITYLAGCIKSSTLKAKDGEALWKMMSVDGKLPDAYYVGKLSSRLVGNDQSMRNHTSVPHSAIMDYCRQTDSGYVQLKVVPCFDNFAAAKLESFTQYFLLRSPFKLLNKRLDFRHLTTDEIETAFALADANTSMLQFETRIQNFDPYGMQWPCTVKDLDIKYRGTEQEVTNAVSPPCPPSLSSHYVYILYLLDTREVHGKSIREVWDLLKRDGQGPFGVYIGKFTTAKGRPRKRNHGDDEKTSLYCLSHHTTVFEVKVITCADEAEQNELESFLIHFVKAWAERNPKVDLVNYYGEMTTADRIIQAFQLAKRETPAQLLRFVEKGVDAEEKWSLEYVCTPNNIKK